MMSGPGSTQQSLRKALGTLKDSTLVGLAKVNSEYKDIDIAIVKATNHEERTPKEKHVRTIFDAVSASRSRTDIQYCISALARRLGKTRNWAVALKILIVIHRALREADTTFRGELINYLSSRGHMLNLSHFKDDSSPDAWDYSAWVRTYALYLEERLECFRVLNFDVEVEDSSMMKELGTGELLEHLPAFQQLLFRLLGCQLEGAAKLNNVIQFAFSVVASESVKINVAIDNGIFNLVNKFFDMPRHDAVRALEIYRKAIQQAERLSEFYEFCNELNLWKSDQVIRIKKPPESFVAAMEEYVKEAPRVPLSPEMELEPGKSPHRFMNGFKKLDNDKAITGFIPQQPPVDLMGFHDVSWDASTFNGRDPLDHDIFPDGKPSSRSTNISEVAEEGVAWELELVSLDESLGNHTVESERSQGGSIDDLMEKLVLDGQPITNQLPMIGVDVVVDSTNPFGDPYGQSSSLPGQPSQSHTGFL